MAAPGRIKVPNPKNFPATAPRKHPTRNPIKVINCFLKLKRTSASLNPFFNKLPRSREA
ncbi:hypothetical protein D3C86_1979760 [compost metagenome]